MLLRLMFFVSFACAISLLGFGASSSEAGPKDAAVSTGFVLVELFTSQGCSSCPPADKALRELAQSASQANLPVLPLSFHVSYWNSLGWRDPYSKDEFSRRQRVYSASIRDGVFTPQAVLNGHLSVVASRKSELDDKVRLLLSNSKVRAVPGFRVAEAQGNQVFVEANFESFDSQKFELIFFKRAAENEVPRGENRGRKLLHSNVVLSVEELSPKSKNFRQRVAKPSGADGLALLVSEPATAKSLALAWAAI